MVLRALNSTQSVTDKGGYRAARAAKNGSIIGGTKLVKLVNKVS